MTTIDTRGVRIVAASLVVAAVWAATSAAAGPPVVRVGTGPSLAVVGTGFVPKALVRVHVVGTEIDRTRSIRAGAAGSFVLRFSEIERCSVDTVTATTSGGTRVRVPMPWFIRNCPPPPPLAPGVNGTD